MKTENILKLDVTLKKLSAITVALHFWELEREKNLIRDFWNRHYPDEKIRQEWTLHNIGFVEKMVDSLDYPTKLLDEIKCYVYVMGGLILDFIQHTTKNGFDVDFGLKICWAPYGRIDEMKMIRECLKGRNKNLPIDNRFLCLPAIYSDKNLIRLNMTALDSHRCILDTEVIYFLQTIYFWNKLPYTEKRESISNEALFCLSKVLGEETKMYIRQKLTEWLIHIMTEMSAIQRLKFVTENWDSLFKAFLETWPYQELGLNILHSMKFEDMPNKLEELFDYVIHLLNSESVIKYKNKSIYHSILQELLKKTPSESKAKYLKKFLKPETSLIFDFNHNSDYMTLSIILNDVEGIKQELIFNDYYFDQFFKMHVKDRNFEFLHKYLEYVLSEEEERKLFKQKLNWVNEFACEGDFELADQLLKFLLDTETERNQQKKKTPSVEVCKFIKEENFEKAQQFVEWRYETDKERKKIKNAMYLLEDIEPAELCADFILNGLFEKVDQYLEWRFETEEEGRTMKESVLKGIDSAELCNRLVRDSEFKTAGKYLKWRFRSPEERHDIKRAVLDLQSMDPFEKCHYLIKEEQYRKADEFLIWLCDTEEERRDMKKFEYERETVDPKEFVNILIREKPYLVHPYIKWRFESDEERRYFKKVLYESDERLRKRCYSILFREKRTCFQFLNDECSDMLKFFLELEEAVNQFRKFKLFDKDAFLKKYKSCSSDYCENFLKYCSRSLNDKGIKQLLAECIRYSDNDDDSIGLGLFD